MSLLLLTLWAALTTGDVRGQSEESVTTGRNLPVAQLRFGASGECDGRLVSATAAYPFERISIMLDQISTNVSTGFDAGQPGGLTRGVARILPRCKSDAAGVEILLLVAESDGHRTSWYRYEIEVDWSGGISRRSGPERVEKGDLADWFT